LRVAGAAGLCALLLLAWPMRGYSQTQTPTGRVHIVPIRIAPKSATTSLAPATSGPSAPICVDSSNQPVTCLFNYYGGPVISNIDVVVVYWGKSVSDVVNCGGGMDSHGNCIGISQFHSAVVDSTFIDMLGEYNTAGVDATAGSKIGVPGTQNIGRGTLHPGSPFIITPSAANSGTKISDSNIQSEIQSQIAAGNLPAPATDGMGNVNTIYMVYFPPGVIIDDGTGSLSCVQFCAYHSTYLSPSKLAVPYGVVPDFGPGSGCDKGCGSGTQWQNITSTTSHELAESITDTAVGLPSSSSLAFDFPLTWYDVNDGEIGDPCDLTSGGTDALQFGAITFVVQQIFSQKAYNLNHNAGCVSPGTPTFTLTAPVTSTPGTAFDVKVAANNGDGSTYLGTVHFTGSDGSASLPADYTFTLADADTHTFTGAVTLNATGPDTIGVSDAQQTSNPGSATVTVNAAAASSLTVSGFPNPTTSGVAGTFTVTAKDALSNTATSYRGTVHFTSSDGSAVLPVDYTFTAVDNGVHSFSATLKTVGTQSLTATDTVSATITGSQTGIVVNAVTTVVSYSALFGSESFNLIGSTRTRLPWEITGIQVVFSQPITVGNINSLTGVNTTAFTGLGTKTLIWSTTPIPIGSFFTMLLASGANAIKDVNGNAINGGTNFTENFKVLWGDFNDDGVVNASDSVLVNNARSSPYNIFADMNGDGVVNASDVNIVRTRIGTSQP
jgi:hypothetical protein